MGRKGKGKKGAGDNKEADDAPKQPQSQEQQVGTSQQLPGRGRGQQTSQPIVGREQQSQAPQQGQGRGQQQQQQSGGRGRSKQQQQQVGASAQQQQQVRGPQQQQPPPQSFAPPPQQQQLPPPAWGPPKQQQPPAQAAGGSTQQQVPPSAWGQPQQQFRGPAPQQQQFRGPSPQQQQFRGPSPQQQQFRGPSPQQQPFRGAPPQHAQQFRGPAPQQQQQQFAGLPAQQAWGPTVQQAWGPPVQQQQQQQLQQLSGQPSQQQQQGARGRGGQAGDAGGQQGGNRGKGRGRDQQRTPEQQPSRSESQQSSRAPSTTPSESSMKSDSKRKQPSAKGDSASAQIEQIISTIEKPGFPQGAAALPAKTKMDEKKMLLEIPQRKDLRQGGKMGRPTLVETNHVALEFKFGKETAVHYDVAITPDNPKRLMRLVWNKFKVKYLPQHHLAFDDFRNAYSPGPLPYDSDIVGEVEVAEDEFSRPRTYRVVMRYAASVNLQELINYMKTGGRLAVPQESLQCIDIVLRNCSAMRFVKVGRSFFSPPAGSIVSLGDGLELWHGFFQSAIIGWKPFLNVDVAHKGFPTPQSVLKLIAEMSTDRYRECRLGDIDDSKSTQIQSFLRGLKIQYEIPQQPGSRRSYRINGLKGNPNETMFEVEGRRMSITDYFRNVKNYRIQYPRIPVLWVGPRDRNIYLPAELCTIMPGQVVNRKLNEIQTAQMVKSAATSTNVRKQKIMSSLNLANFNKDPVVQAFGMTVGNEFEKVKARLLNAPKLQYGRNQVQPAKGVWRAETFLSPSNVSSWTVINLDRRTKADSVSDFARNIKSDASKLGIVIGEPYRPFTQMDRFQRNEFQNTLDSLKNSGVKIAFVIIPDVPSNVYSQVKQTAEISVGLVTQCIKSRTMYRMNSATIGNILLKVNAKMNGLNHTIADISRPPCLRQPCMIMGADVTHPSPDQNDIPSVAAVTASCDPKAFKYNFCWRLQPARQEIIEDLETIVKEQLDFFYKKSGQKPERIIFFRDGVSEGQFREVMNVEVQAIRRACTSMQGNFRPPITFLVVQKRHHTRFFPKPGETDDKNNNVRAGTVVDTDITHPSDLEYYLVSHASIQGVARPTKYRVLWDDSNMGEDELEHLTYYLCHLFSRCTRSVSYPAPTYYAHLAAFRARVYLEGRNINLNNLSVEQGSRAIKEEVSRNFPMFFV